MACTHLNRQPCRACKGCWHHPPSCQGCTPNTPAAFHGLLLEPFFAPSPPATFKHTQSQKTACLLGSARRNKTVSKAHRGLHPPDPSALLGLQRMLTSVAKLSGLHATYTSRWILLHPRIALSTFLCSPARGGSTIATTSSYLDACFWGWVVGVAVVGEAVKR